MSNTLDDLDSDLAEVIIKGGVKSVAACPVWIDGGLYGGVVVESHANYRQWNREEILLLNNIAMLLSPIFREMTPEWRADSTLIKVL
jgi:GAF domain-containing protein